MTKEQKRIKIAEFCGWENITSHKVNKIKVFYGWHPTIHPRSIHRYETLLPEYFQDLNDMYKAEKQGLKKIGESFWVRYSDALEDVRKDQRGKTLRQWHTSANQRAEAFVKVIDSLKQ